MAWSTRLPEKSEIDGNYQYWEYVDIEQVESTQAGYIRLKIVDYAKYWPGGYFAEGFFTIIYNGITYKSETAMPRVGSTGNYVSTTVYINIPNSLSGKQVRFSGRITGWDATIGAFTGFKLTIVKNKNISAVTVKRTHLGAGIGSLGILSNGALIYTNDVLEITATAATGYKIKDLITPITVSSNVTISPTASPMATIQIWDGTKWSPHLIYIWSGSSWDLYQATIWDGNKWNSYY